MKKIKAISLSMFVILMTIASCDNPNISYQYNPIVISVEKHIPLRNKVYCEYQVRWMDDERYVRTAYLNDDCGKYQIGDTIQTIKR